MRDSSETSGMRINQRAKPGKGKQFYGLPQGSLDKLSAVAGNPRIRSALLVADLCQFTAVSISHARALAMSGQKDEARTWLRFFTNSRVLDVIADSAPELDTQSLRVALGQLRSECHPLDAPTWTTDIEAIRAFMAEILNRIPPSAIPGDLAAGLRLVGCGGRRRGQARPASARSAPPGGVSLIKG